MNTAVLRKKLLVTLAVALLAGATQQPLLAQSVPAYSQGNLQHGRAVPQWNDNRNDNRSVNIRQGSLRHGSGNNRGSNSGFTFNSSLGYIPNATIDTLATPRSNYGQGQVIVIQPGNRPTGYAWDHSGNCIETRADRFGTTYRRKTGRHNCNF